MFIVRDIIKMQDEEEQEKQEFEVVVYEREQD